MNFESELSKGIFCIPQCVSCKKTVWPPAEICDNCFSQVILKVENPIGKIIEFSKHNEEYFCVVEFKETVRIIAKTLQIPTIGKNVKISKCGIKDKQYFFYVS